MRRALHLDKRPTHRLPEDSLPRGQNCWQSGDLSQGRGGVDTWLLGSVCTESGKSEGNHSSTKDLLRRRPACGISPRHPARPSARASLERVLPGDKRHAERGTRPAGRLHVRLRRQAAPTPRQDGQSLQAHCTDTTKPWRGLLDRDSEVRVQRPGPQRGLQYLAGPSFAPE
jgi:hypothetical protein